MRSSRSYQKNVLFSKSKRVLSVTTRERNYSDSSLAGNKIGAMRAMMGGEAIVPRGMRVRSPWLGPRRVSSSACFLLLLVLHKLSSSTSFYSGRVVVLLPSAFKSGGPACLHALSHDAPRARHRIAHVCD